MNNFIFPAFNGTRLHLGVCGSVAAYKAIDLMRLLQKQGLSVSVSLTDSAKHFISPLSFSSLGAERVYGQMFDHSELESPFSHLEPGASCYGFAIAPATASCLARLAAGFADDMLSAQALAFDAPLVIAPAMNPKMWNNPATQDNVRKLLDYGHIIVEPSFGTVACGDKGDGKLAPVSGIAWHILRALAKRRGFNSLAGEKILITIGPTREQWDGVRFWSNYSTGLMGSSLAIAAWLRGAEVHAVVGPGVEELPSGIHSHHVVSAKEMFKIAKSLWTSCSAGIFTAAVADFSPKPFGSEKFKKQGHQSGFSVEFEANPDILATLAKERRSGQKVIGFAAETSDLEVRTRDKLKNKAADMIVGNAIGKPGSGFGSLSNDVFICTAGGAETKLPRMNKPELAWLLLDRLCEL